MYESKHGCYIITGYQEVILCIVSSTIGFKLWYCCYVHVKRSIKYQANVLIYEENCQHRSVGRAERKNKGLRNVSNVILDFVLTELNERMGEMDGCKYR